MKTSVINNLTFNKETKEYIYTLKFSNNAFTMIYKNKDIIPCLERQNLMDTRIHNFFVKRTSKDLITNDIGFKYKKII